MNTLGVSTIRFLKNHIGNSAFAFIIGRPSNRGKINRASTNVVVACNFRIACLSTRQNGVRVHGKTVKKFFRFDVRVPYMYTCRSTFSLMGSLINYDGNLSSSSSTGEINERVLFIERRGPPFNFTRRRLNRETRWSERDLRDKFAWLSVVFCFF